MHMLYDSDTFVVVHIEATEGDIPNPRHCFEIVDKRENKEVLLDGSWAELFQRHINGWHLNVPAQEEVEAVLSQYAQLAQLPLVMH